MSDKFVQRVLLDEAKRLSECSIWELLAHVYQSAPPRSLWEGVPSHITSSAFFAEVYADLLVSFFRDYYSSFDFDQPLYVVELGSGSGCFSFYLLNELFRKMEYFPALARLKVRYIMSDFTANTLSDCREHENFTPFRDSGSLSFAVFKPEDDSEIVTYGGTRLASDTVKNPVVVIANYVLDSMRHDGFRVEDGKLQEIRHTFYRRLDGRPDNFDQIEKVESYAEVTGSYYEDPAFDGILEFYQRRFKNATIVFPIGALRAVRNLRTISNNNLVLLSSDRGFTRADYVEGLWDMRFQSEESFFSYPVNYYAIRKYFDAYGGTSFASSGESLFVHTQMSCLLQSECRLEQTRYSFGEVVEKKNPMNFLYNWQEFLGRKTTRTASETLMAYIGLIRLCNCDPIVFCHYAQRISNSLSGAQFNVKDDLSDLLAMVEDNFFFVRKKYDSLYWIGKLRYELKEYDGAVSALRKSITEFGETHEALYCLASCYEAKGNMSAALDNYQGSLKFSPDSELTAESIARVKALL